MIEVVCGLIEDGNGAWLACRRPAGKHLGGLWEFPGGKIEPGESPAVALVRELAEELDVTVEVGGALQPVEWHDAAVSIRLLPFHCRIVHGKPRPIEHEELAWCRPEDFDQLAWAPADVPILRELQGGVAISATEATN